MCFMIREKITLSNWPTLSLSSPIKLPSYHTSMRIFFMCTLQRVMISVLREINLRQPVSMNTFLSLSPYFFLEAHFKYEVTC